MSSPFLAAADVQPQRSSPGWIKVLMGILTAGLLASGFMLYRLQQDVAAVQARQAAADARLQDQLAATRADLKSSTSALAAQLGMTQKQLDQRAAALRREQQAAEERIASEQKQQITAVSGEVAGVKGQVGDVKTEADTTKSELDATRAKLERTIGDLNVQSGLVAHTRDDLEVLKHKGDRNYYEFTLAKSKRPTPVGTVSLQLRKTDAKHGKFTLDVVSDDHTITKKDKNLFEPLQFYSGKDRNLFEIVVFTMGKDSITGYLSTPKSAPAPIEVGKSSGM
ncbi:MAG TPA: hypothetical protein VE998_09825 [Terriglobales bacterium]|nr:hypothetical protein [Terriglobales bacterium]